MSFGLSIPYPSANLPTSMNASADTAPHQSIAFNELPELAGTGSTFVSTTESGDSAAPYIPAPQGGGRGSTFLSTRIDASRAPSAAEAIRMDNITGFTIVNGFFGYD